MSDNNDEKTLPVLRLLLAVFFVLLFALALQLILVLARADAATTIIRVGYPQLNGCKTPLWNIPKNNYRSQSGIGQP
jgi:hypothetical protein